MTATFAKLVQAFAPTVVMASPVVAAQMSYVLHALDTTMYAIITSARFTPHSTTPHSFVSVMHLITSTQQHITVASRTVSSVAILREYVICVPIHGWVTVVTPWDVRMEIWMKIWFATVGPDTMMVKMDSATKSLVLKVVLYVMMQSTITGKNVSSAMLAIST